MKRAILLGLICLPVSVYAGFGDGVLLDVDQLARLEQQVSHKLEPSYSAYLALIKQVDSQLAHSPHAPSVWYVPPYYDKPRAHKAAKVGLQNDANLAYKMALAYRLTRDSRYAEVAARIIVNWYTTLRWLKTQDDSPLSFSYHFPAMIFAASLIQDFDGFKSNQQTEFKRWIRRKALPLGINIIGRSNNWGNWGLLMVTATATYLGDRALFAKCLRRYREFIATQIGPRGEMTHEVRRNHGMGEHGLWYSHFSLMPLTLTAEIMRVNGKDLFDYRAPNGRSLKLAFQTIARWSKNPARFPYFKGNPEELSNPVYVSYFEILNQHWPNDNAKDLLNQLRPLDAHHSAPALTLTHGGVGSIH